MVGVVCLESGPVYVWPQSYAVSMLGLGSRLFEKLGRLRMKLRGILLAVSTW